MLAMTLLLVWGATDVKAVEVTLTVDEGVDRPAGLEAAQRNLGLVLTEINRAQQAKEILTTKDLPMDDFSLRSLVRLWALHRSIATTTKWWSGAGSSKTAR